MKSNYQIFTEKLSDCYEMLFSCQAWMFDFNEPKFTEEDFDFAIMILFGMLEREVARGAQDLINCGNGMIYLGDIDEKLRKDFEPIEKQLCGLVEKVLLGTYMDGVESNNTFNKNK